MSITRQLRRKYMLLTAVGVLMFVVATYYKVLITSDRLQPAICELPNKTGSTESAPKRFNVKGDELETPVINHRGLRASVSCSKLISGDKSELEVARTFQKTFTKNRIPDDDFIKLAKNCTHFKSTRGYILDKFQSEEEKSFPIAFTIPMYHYVDQVEHLLRTIYRPNNIYCIHVDKNSIQSVNAGMKAITDCFPNVFLSSKRTAVVYGGYSVLQAHLNCMEDAVNHVVPWKYLINLSGEMFPLKTNHELVRILKTFNGKNNICSQSAKEYKYRWEFKHIEMENNTRPVKTSEKNPSPPHNITLVKGNVYGAYTRPFLKYALFHPVAKDFLSWSTTVTNAEEFFFTTLNNAFHNPHLSAPGSYSGKYRGCRVPMVNWASLKNPCKGLDVRQVCIPGVESLPRLTNTNKMFVNKLLPFTHDYIVMECLEEWIRNQTLSTG